LKKSLAASLAALGLAGVLTAAGCGSSNDSSSSTTTPTTTTTATTPPASDQGSASATKLTIAADAGGQLKFDKSKLNAKAGEVTVVMDNPSTIPHAVSIEGNGVDKNGTGGSSGVGQGQKSTVSVKLKPGTYSFYCPVDGHEQAGMKGTLTVN
jgi:uncharacterized cupredoxin-like copper-binding protein